jgi:hypothetical protein
MLTLPHPGLRISALAIILAAGVSSPRAVEDRVTHADTRSGDPVGTADGAFSKTLPLKGSRPTPVPCGTPPKDAPRCSIAVAYPEDVRSDRRVILTDLVSDKDCPSELNTTIGLTFEIDNPAPRRNLWWRRAASSFDVLYPSSGSITAAGKNRVSLSNLVLDQTVTVEVLEGDQRLMSFTLKHF